MGMAASQARYLSLTARKSNVEYQGQQVNQKRTSLSNQSANLYNQMMTMEVPTPPDSESFYYQTYSFTSPYDNKKYTISDFNTVYNTVTIQYTEDIPIVQKANKYMLYKYENGEHNFTCNGVAATLTALANIDDPNKLAAIGNGNQEYWASCLDENGSYIPGSIYQVDFNNESYYITKEQYENLINGQESTNFNIWKFGQTTTTRTTDVNVSNFTFNSTGRLASIQVSEDYNNLGISKDEPISLDFTKVKDDEAYEAAMNDYKYKQAQYEKIYADLNAQTEIIQRQDKNLELQLKSLDTEQNAIQTEMEAVKKVIDKNVESTFKTFNA